MVHPCLPPGWTMCYTAQTRLIINFFRIIIDQYRKFYYVVIISGSTHTTLMPYWSKRLRKKKVHARQLSSRGGDLFCADLESRVEIGGYASTYLEGFITIQF